MGLPHFQTWPLSNRAGVSFEWQKITKQVEIVAPFMSKVYLWSQVGFEPPEKRRLDLIENSYTQTPNTGKEKRLDSKSMSPSDSKHGHF